MKPFFLGICVVWFCYAGICLGNFTSKTSIGISPKETTGNIDQLYQAVNKLVYYSCDSAQIFADSALRLSELKDSDYDKCKALLAEGIVYRFKSMYYKSLQYLLLSSAIAEKGKFFKLYTENLRQIAFVNLSQKNYPEAIKNINKGFELLKAKPDKMQTANFLYLLGRYNEGMGNYTSATVKYKASNKLYQSLRLREQQSLSLTALGKLFFAQEKYDSSLYYLTLALKEADSIHFTYQRAYLLNNLAFLKYTEKKYADALPLQLESIKLGEQLKNNDLLALAYGNLGGIYAALGDYKSAYTADTIDGRYNDIVKNEQQTNALAEVNAKYKAEQQSAEIKKQQITRNYLFLALALILVIALVVFNRYRYELKTNKVIGAEKQRSEELLRNILPQETADELKEFGKTTARYYEEVSVMFADVKGFTLMAEQMSAEALVADLDRYFGTFDVIMERYGLEKIKTIGDAYLCTGGLPNPENGTPEKVVLAALEMQEYVAQVKQEKIAANESYFEIRIGIHTGPLVAGVVGIKKFAYDIWGDTVNMAARMEQYGEPGKVNVSEQTYQKIKDKFTCIPRGNIEVKSKGAVPMYFVEA